MSHLLLAQIPTTDLDENTEDMMIIVSGKKKKTVGRDD